MYLYNGWQIDDSGFLFSQERLSAHPNFISSVILYLSSEYDEIKKDDRGVLFPHNIIASLDREIRETLLLPPAYPFYIKIAAINGLGDQDLRFSITYHFDDNQQIVNPCIIGCFFQVADGDAYAFTQDQYLLTKGTSSFNKLSTTNKTLNAAYRQIAQIKDLSAGLRIRLDKLCSETDIIMPSKLSVTLKNNDDGTLQIIPQLSPHEMEKSSYGLNGEIQQINEAFGKRFQHPKFKVNKENIIHPSDESPYIIIDDNQRAALNNLKIKNIVKVTERENFVKFPETILDPEIFNLDDFSDRVKELGIYRPRVFPFLKPFKESWLPPECGLLIDQIPLHLDKEEIRELIPKIKDAIADGAATVNTGNGNIPASHEVLTALESLAKETAEWTPSGTNKSVAKTDRSILIIYDNIEKKDYDTKKLDAISAARSHPLPKHLKSTLLPHQNKGFQWLMNAWQRRLKGALLADDMGLGKTLQGLALIAAIKERMDSGGEEKKRFLIVAPVSLLDNWRSEYHKFFDTTIFGEPLALHGRMLALYKRGQNLAFDSMPQDCLVLTTYETLRDQQCSFGKINWSVIILDEAQKIKTPTARMTYAAKAMKYDFGLCMTGTPVENSWVDLWSIMDFALPGQLGCLKDFNTKYQSVLAKEGTDVKALGSSLKEQIQPFMLRRLKADVCDGLPAKHEHKKKVEMSQAQLNEYLSIVSQAKAQLKDKAENERRPHILKTILTLRDISLYKDGASALSLAALDNLSTEDILNGSARMKVTLEILEEIRHKQEKVIIFILSRNFQYVLLKIIKEKLGIEAFGPINGSIIGHHRFEIINKFQEQRGFQVLILSPEAAGVGLNITEANHVIHLSRLWNPAKEDQATDRAYRIGQKRVVHVYYPMAVHSKLGENGSFDEKLDNLLRLKRELSANVMLPPENNEDFGYAFGESILNETDDTIDSNCPSITMKDIDMLTGMGFEKYVLAIYKKQGHEASLTSITNDYGADIIVSPKNGDIGVLIQCKHVNNPEKSVSAEGVREVCASLGTYSYAQGGPFVGIVVTNAFDFTENAKITAKANNIELISRTLLRKWVEEFKITGADINLM